MRNLKFLIFILVVLLSACNKYEDGPFFSLRSAKARVCQTWKIESYTVNGVDSLENFKTHPLYCDKYDFQEIDYQKFIESSGCFNNVISYIIHGTWGLDNNDKVLRFSLSSVEYNGIYVLAEAGTGWEILRLSKKEMWLKTDFDSKEYEIHFKTL